MPADWIDWTDGKVRSGKEIIKRKIKVPAWTVGQLERGLAGEDPLPFSVRREEEARIVKIV
jgi:hypothetical protein